MLSSSTFLGTQTHTSRTRKVSMMQLHALPGKRDTIWVHSSAQPWFPNPGQPRAKPQWDILAHKAFKTLAGEQLKVTTSLQVSSNSKTLVQIRYI